MSPTWETEGSVTSQHMIRLYWEAREPIGVKGEEVVY